MSPASDGYLRLKQLSVYCGLSVRTLRYYLSSPVHPLPYYRVRRKILVRRSDFDAWLSCYRHAEQSVDLDALVSEVLSELQ
ncbi:MAG TPA: helix-turn-helix domain-containing protein [Alphaproteobacteria bacterium]|nr:helix-turn-helix domain-containing protein [Alphaproteobacteria bacterium]